MRITSMAVIQKELVRQATRFLENAYGLELDIPIEINNRLKKTYGRFIYNQHGKFPVKIEMGKNYIEHQDWNTVLETLIHECIHYALYVQNLPHRDGDAVFEAELKKYGSHSSGTVKYKGKIIQYGCPSCDTIYNRKRRFSKNRIYTSGCCNQTIVFLGEKVI